MKSDFYTAFNPNANGINMVYRVTRAFPARRLLLLSCTSISFLDPMRRFCAGGQQKIPTMCAIERFTHRKLWIRSSDSGKYTSYVVSNDTHDERLYWSYVDIELN